MKALLLLAVAILITSFAHAQGVTAIDHHLDNRKRFLDLTRASGADSPDATSAETQVSERQQYHIARWRSFDVPGAGPMGTFPVSINDLGEIVGNYNDATPSQSQHGMVVTPDGQVTTFDPPGSIYTDPRAINNLGTVVGRYYDELDQGHGFVRTREGQMTTIDFPGAISTMAHGINDLGAISGWYVDASFVAHGFLREPNGSYITIDGPNSQVITFCFVVNASGEVGCQYIANIKTNFWRGLLRRRDGSIEVFDAPGVADNSACFVKSQGVLFPSGTEIGEFRNLTNAGVVSGHWEDTQCRLHGFVRSAIGRFEVFALPPTAVWALAAASNSVNDFGAVVGCYGFQDNRERSYARFPNGELIAVVPLHPKHKGVCALAINTVNVFTGYWLDQNGTSHGFVAEAIP